MRRLLFAAVCLLPFHASAQFVSSAPSSGRSPAVAAWAIEPTPIVVLAGDSRVAISSVYQTASGGSYAFPQSIWQPGNVLTWARRLSGVRYSTPQIGYIGTQFNGTPFKATVIAGGSGYTTGSTCTFGTGNGTMGAPTVDANGAVTSIPVTSGGSTILTSAPTISCTGGSGLSAIGVLGATGTFGNPGETSQQFLARIGDIETAVPVGSVIVLRIGTNDETGGLTLAQSNGFMKSIFDRLLADGYWVVYVLDGPRLAWGGFSDASAPAPQYRKQMYARREFVARYKASLVSNPTSFNHLVLIDTFAEQVDTTNAFGDPQTGLTSDGLHDSQISAWVTGYKIAQVLNQMFPASSDSTNLSAAQVYDATYNPYAAVNANPILSGTAGTMPATAGGLTVSGTAPTSYTVSTSGTTGTQTLTGSAPARGDGYNGTMTRLAVVCGTTGAATQTYTIAPSSYVTLASLGLSSATNGTVNAPVMRARAIVRYSGLAKLQANALTLLVADVGTTVMSSTDGNSTNTSAGDFPTATYGTVPPPTATNLFYMTKEVTLNNIGTVATTQVQVKPSFAFGIDCSGGAGSGTATVDVLYMSAEIVPQ